ncbi:MAG: glycosyltransferase [Candidatus Zixiibacteriota bacterium]
MSSQFEYIPKSVGVTVVTVTYGKRWDYLKSVLQAVAAEDAISRIIVVDNGAEHDFVAEARRLTGLKLVTVSLGHNRGSAIGFKAGLKLALEFKDAEYIWLLDDDNRPEPGALKELLRYFLPLERNQKKDSLLTLSLRIDRKQYRRVAQGEPIARWFPQSNSFLGFHIFWLPFWRIIDILKRTPERDNRPFLPFLEVPVAPWGGMFFHKSLIEKHGYPETDFFLYGDDTEFALRFRHAGGKIFLIPSSQLTDLEESWHSRKRVAPVMFLKNYAEAPSFRIYYGVRNSTYLWNKYFRKNRFLFGINRYIFLMMLKFYLSWRGEKERYLLIKNAVADGDRGNLGERAGF